jgi:hypothetical protein
MSQKEFESLGNDLIQCDLKRLKKWKSLETDISSIFQIINGRVTDLILNSYTNFGTFLTEKELDGVKVLFYKERVAILNPRTPPSKGARLVFGVFANERVFLPIFVYAAEEEKKYYNINGKRFPLTASNLTKIIEEKLKSIPE